MRVTSKQKRIKGVKKKGTNTITKSKGNCIECMKLMGKGGGEKVISKPCYCGATGSDCSRQRDALKAFTLPSYRFRLQHSKRSQKFKYIADAKAYFINFT